MRRGRELGVRLALREYTPLVAWIASWALITAGAGLSGAILLLSASQLTGAVRALAMIDVRGPLRRAFRRGGRLDPAGWRAVWAYELAASLLSLAAIFALAAAIEKTAYAELAAPLRIMGFGLPALYAGPALALLVARNRDTGVAHLIKGAGSVALVAMVLILDLGLAAFAAALASRWWIGLLAVIGLLFVPARPGGAGAIEGEESRLYRPTWREISAQTRESSQRRLAYRLSKMVFSGMFGPLGSFFARTLRGTRQLRRFQLSGGALIGVLVLVMIVASGAATWLLLIPGHELKLVLATALVRMACIAAGTLFWTAIARGRNIPIDDDDDDDDFA